MNAENNNQQNQPGNRRPSLCFYHANPKGTGSAARMNLHPAHDMTDGCVMLRIANQMTVGDRRGPNPTFPRFDWENSLCVKLAFEDLTEMLRVFRGECESINDGKGLFHRSPKGLTNIRLRHLLGPVQGYSLDVYRGESRAGILLNPAEALGLCESISGALYLVSFGIPMLVPHDTSAYEAQAREVRHDAAAA